MSNKSSRLSDGELQDLSDQEASLIAGGQVTSISQLSDVQPQYWMTDPIKRQILGSEIIYLAKQEGQR